MALPAYTGPLGRIWHYTFLVICGFVFFILMAPILVIIPLFLPTCRALGIDLVHFGVVAVVNTMIGLITPPYGILLFVINAVTKIPLGEIIREVLPFLGVLILALAVMILVPDVVLFLPRLFGYAG